MRTWTPTLGALPALPDLPGRGPEECRLVSISASSAGADEAEDSSAFRAELIRDYHVLSCSRSAVRRRPRLSTPACIH